MDIHPNLGPLRTAVANVTSQRLHAAEVASWEVGVIFLHETKLSRGGGGEGHTPLYCQKGVAMFLGMPAGYQGGGGMWNTPEGGVLVLVREGLTADLARLPCRRELDPLVWGLWHST